MRRVAILVFIILFFYSTAPADVIHLKNGRTISADRVHQNGDKLEYEIGDDSYAIPMSTVDKIESGLAPSSGGVTSATASGTQQGSSELRREMPNASALFAEINAAESAAVAAKVIGNGEVDHEALARIENMHNSHLTALAYDAVAANAERTGDLETAERYLRLALSLEPQQSLATAHYASLLIESFRYAEAEPVAEQATRLAPRDPQMWYLLGMAHYFSNHAPAAIEAWKHSLSLRPSYRVQQLLARAQREQIVQADYRNTDSVHFILEYEGQQTSPELRQSLVRALESDFDDLSNEFGFSPRDSIAVVVYTNRDYSAATDAPSWSDGFNDGKIRIPVKNMESLTPEVAGVLKHELSHTFIRQISRDRCPQWLNEGIAQLEQGRSSASYGALLRVLYSQNKQIPLSRLEGSFAVLPGMVATVAYAESVAAAEVIRDGGGFSDLVRILGRIGSGMTTDQALRSTIHSSYSDLDDQIKNRVAGK